MSDAGNLGERLFAAARHGSLAAVQACLAAGADPNLRGYFGRTALLDAAEWIHADCVEALLAAGADLTATSVAGNSPLHLAASRGCRATTAALLAAGACPAAVNRHRGSTPLHFAAALGHATVVKQLLAACPAAAALRDSDGRTPLQHALRGASADAARCLLELHPRQPAGELLAEIEQAGQQGMGSEAAQLYMLLVSCQPLAPGEWVRIPGALPGLAAALPAVLDRSAEEAGLLVRRLPPADAARLRALALALGCAQRRRRLPPLPTPIEWRLLALSLSD